MGSYDTYVEVTWKRANGDGGESQETKGRGMNIRSPCAKPKGREAATVTPPRSGSTDATRSQSRVPSAHRNRPAESKRYRLSQGRGQSEEWTSARKANGRDTNVQTGRAADGAGAQAAAPRADPCVR